jgi:hypothetical protein
MRYSHIDRETKKRHLQKVFPDGIQIPVWIWNEQYDEYELCEDTFDIVYPWRLSDREVDNWFKGAVEDGLIKEEEPKKEVPIRRGKDLDKIIDEILEDLKIRR